MDCTISGGELSWLDCTFMEPSRQPNRIVQFLEGRLVPVAIYRVNSSHRTPNDTAHKQIIDQYTSIIHMVKTLKEGNNSWPNPTQPLQAIY